MATAYSGEVAVGSYNRIRLRVEYSGSSASCYIEFRRTSSYTGTWADSQASITLNGVTNAAPYNYSGTVGTNWVQLCSAGGFSVPTSGGTLGWSFNNPGGSSVLGCSGTIDIPSQVSPPTGLACTVSEVGPDFAKFNVSISSYGNPSSENGRWIEAGIAGQNAWQSPSLRSAIVQNVTSATITVDNNSSQTTTLTIVPNTEYYYGAYATNTQASIGNTFGQLVTLPPAATISNPVVTSDSATFNYSVPDQGGRHDMTLSYQLDGGSLTTITTLTGSGTKAGTFTVSNLSAGTTHTVTAALTTSAGEVVSNTITFTTVSSGAFYGSVNGQTKKVTKLYGSVNGQTKLITKLYGSVNGVTKRILQEGGAMGCGGKKKK